MDRIKERNNFTVTVEDFNIPLTIMDRMPDRSKKTEDLYNIVNQLYLTALHPRATHTFFSGAHPEVEFAAAYGNSISNLVKLLFSLVISSLIYLLRVCCFICTNLCNFPVDLLLLIFMFTLLWLGKILCIMSLFLTLLRLISWLNI